MEQVDRSGGQDTAGASTAPIEPSVNRCEGQDHPGTTGTLFLLPLWFAPVYKMILYVMMKLFRQDYRFFLHDPERLARAAAEAGHVVAVTRAIGLWQLVVLTR